MKLKMRNWCWSCQEILALSMGWRFRWWNTLLNASAYSSETLEYTKAEAHEVQKTIRFFKVVDLKDALGPVTITVSLPSNGLTGTLTLPEQAENSVGVILDRRTVSDDAETSEYIEGPVRRCEPYYDLKYRSRYSVDVPKHTARKSYDHATFQQLKNGETSGWYVVDVFANHGEYNGYKRVARARVALAVARTGASKITCWSSTPFRGVFS
jgi:hypothetical protein